MASATDIITYIGVPLAVLGVTPIFYTFLSALYTKSKLGHILHKNGIECPIRAKLMTGTIEVDLPVYNLTSRFRDLPVPWLVSKPAMGVGGASWSCHDFHKVVSQRNTIRLQRSDKLVLPAAEIIFKSLLDYLLDMGYLLDEEGFRTLRTRRQQTSEGVVLMYMKFGRTLLFAGPGVRHGSIVLQFSEPPRSTNHSIPNHRDPTQTLPPFHLTAPLLEIQDELSAANDNPTAINEGPNVSTDADETHSTEEKRRYFVMKWTAILGLEISIHETPAPSMGVKLPNDHILSQLHPDNDLANGTPWGEPFNWFACAAIAVYGFDSGVPKPFYEFSPNEGFLHAVECYHLEFSVVALHGLTRSDTKDLNGLLNFVDVDPYDPASVNRTESSQQAQHMDTLAKVWITRSDLIYYLTEWEKYSGIRARFLLSSKDIRARDDFHEAFSTRHIDMPNLLRMCIGSLLSRPMRLKSLLIGSLPKEPSSLDHITQHIADQILRMAILDSDFAKGIRAQTHQLLKSPVAGALEAAIQARKGKKKKKHRESLEKYNIRDALIERFRCSQKDTDHFCCAVVLLAVIRQRADFLRSGDDIRQCVSDWPTVNLS